MTPEAARELTERLARLATVAQRLTLDDLDARMLDVRVVTEP